jgi:hypothetical protein
VWEILGIGIGNPKFGNDEYEKEILNSRPVIAAQRSLDLSDLNWKCCSADGLEYVNVNSIVNPQYLRSASEEKRYAMPLDRGIKKMNESDF